MPVNVARSGQVILTLETLDDLRAEVEAGRVLPTDHYIVIGMPSWHLVAALPPPQPAGFAAPPAVPAADYESENLGRVRAQILELVNAAPFSKPSRCKHCGAAELRAAKLVWQQGTRVGGAIDTDLDITIFGSSSLQGLAIAPPPEPSLPGRSSGGCLSTVVAGLIFFMVPGLFNMVAMLFVIPLLDGYIGKEPTFASRVIGVLGFVYFIGIFYLGFRLARRFHRWDSRRGLRRVCETELERAKLHARWRNTWICMSCGEKTVVVAAGQLSQD